MATRNRGRKVYPVEPDEFIRTWQTSESAAEVAKKLRMPKPIVLARATNYRQMGIKLKSMKPPPRRGLDIEAMNGLIEKLRKDVGGEASPSIVQIAPDEDAADVMKKVLKSLKG